VWKPAPAIMCPVALKRASEMRAVDALPAPPSGMTLALANMTLSLVVVLFVSISVTWRPRYAEDFLEYDQVHVPTYCLQTFEIMFSLTILFYECCSKDKPQVTVTLAALVCSAAAAITMMVQVAHKTSLRTPGASLFIDLHDINDPYPWPARIISHQGFDHAYEWVTLVVVFGAQATSVVFSVTLSALRWTGCCYRPGEHGGICFLDCNVLILHAVTTVATCVHESCHFQRHKTDVLAHMMVFYVLSCFFLAIPSLLWVVIQGGFRHLRPSRRSGLLNRPIVTYSGSCVCALVFIATGGLSFDVATVIAVSLPLGTVCLPLGYAIHRRALRNSDAPLKKRFAKHELELAEQDAALVDPHGPLSNGTGFAEAV